jgi:steroid 5-alpha reductase family enzyme
MTAIDFGVLLASAILLATVMAFAWVVRMRSGRSGFIDAIWSGGVGVAGLLAALAPGAVEPGRAWMVAALVAAWSARLAGHIAARTRDGGDDPRYAELARQWGADFARRLFVFLQIQAACGVVLVLAIRLAATNPAPFPGLIDLLAGVVVIAAIVGEAIADAQLTRFRRASPPRGAVCETGLWGWSRHPNYFFEWLGWCGFALFALDPTGARMVGLVALAAPALVYVLLVHVSGIPPLEAHMLASRGAAYRALRARVSAFFPRPPRRPSR